MKNHIETLVNHHKHSHSNSRISGMEVVVMIAETLASQISSMEVAGFWKWQ